MGFIQPGRRVKRRKVTSTSEQERPVPKNIEKPRPALFSLQDLPIELICKIFIFAEPGNSLPIANSYFNQVLKFDPYSTDESWKNVSLAMKMVVNHYSVPLNEKLDFSLIDEMLFHCGEILCSYESQYANNQYCKLMKLNLERLQANRIKFQSCDFGISTKVLDNKFISKRFLLQITETFPNIPIHEPQVLQLENSRRLLYFVLSFKLVGYYIDKLTNSPLDEEPEVLTNIQLINVGDTLSKRLYSPKDISLEDWVNDDKSPVTIEKHVIQYCSHPHTAIKYTPKGIYKNGIDSLHKFELLSSLQLLNFKIEFADRLFVSTLAHFAPENLSNLNYKELSLTQIIYHFSMTVLLQYTMIEFFRLYDTYSQINMDSFETNREGKTIYEDVTSTIKPLLDHYFLNGKRNCDEMWRYVLKSENDSLAEILWVYSGPPPMNLLHEDD